MGKINKKGSLAMIKKQNKRLSQIQSDEGLSSRGNNDDLLA